MGAYYVPPGYRDRALPLLVAIHGTSGDGAGMVQLLRATARARSFIVVAPDSRIAPNGQASWQVPRESDDVTEDADHIRRCVEEVEAMQDVRIDTRRTLVAGHSGGGSTAPYEASTDPTYTAFAVLHGGAFPGGFGSRLVRGWFSTGDADPIRPPTMVAADAQRVRDAGFDSVVYRVFPGGHDVGAMELAELIRWWLGDA